MPHLDLILTLTGGLAAALVLGYLTHRLGLSPIVGYLMAGIAVGPHTPGFIANRALAEQLADVGVMLLMFGVGLQFHLTELLAVRRVAIPGAVAQSLVSTGLGAIVAHAFGWDWTAGIVFDLALTRDPRIQYGWMRHRATRRLPARPNAAWASLASSPMVRSAYRTVGLVCVCAAAPARLHVDMVHALRLAGELAALSAMPLLFGVGLRLAVGDLLAMRTLALPGAVIQMAVTTILGIAVARVGGWTVGAGLVCGLALSVASAVVWLHALDASARLDAAAGRMAVNWLTVEALAMLVILTLLPVMTVSLGGMPPAPINGPDRSTGQTGGSASHSGSP
jgi:predicted Kef-type K+ transport protein